MVALISVMALQAELQKSIRADYRVLSSIECIEPGTSQINPYERVDLDGYTKGIFSLRNYPSATTCA